MTIPPYVHLLISGGSLIFFVAAATIGASYSDTGKLFPVTVGLAGAVIACVALLKDVALVRSTANPFSNDSQFTIEVRTVGISFGWMLLYVWLVFVLGMYLGTAAFAIAFLLVVARTKVLTAIIYASGIVASLWALVEFAQLKLPHGWLF